MKWDKVGISLSVLIIFYVVGVIGIGFQLKPDMVNLSWLNLLLTGLLLSINKTESDSKFSFFFIIVFIIGLVAEIVGTATGFPFGTYYYGNSLGWKIFDVPLVLGLNWWILVYCSIHLSILIINNIVARAFLAPAIMLGLDLMIEPLCSKLDFWHWQNIEAPWENYLSWYLIAFVLTILYFSWFKTTKKNLVAVGAFIIQVLFFTILNLLL